MPRIVYTPKNFGEDALARIATANEILETYTAQGFDLTLRQLFYQFVSRALIENSEREYKRLGDLISDARLAGLIDWAQIVDRTRYIRQNSHWADPSKIVESASTTYALDKWNGQRYRPEIWIEKDALIGVIGGISQELDCPHFSCRGYTSQSEMWWAAQRLIGYQRKGQIPLIVHLGDHDPSGKDMTRDIADRLELFTGGKIYLKRIALNFDQVKHYNPPPNPTKFTDSRAEGYIAEYGEECWELDALEPGVIVDLIRDIVMEHRDSGLWDKLVDQETQGRGELAAVAANWSKATKAAGKVVLS